MDSWKKELAQIFKGTGHAEAAPPPEAWGRVRHFLDDIVEPAFLEFRAELEKHRRNVHIENDHEQAIRLDVVYRGNREFSCAVEVEWTEGAARAHVRERREDSRGKSFVAETRLGKPIGEITSESLLRDVVSRYAMACATGK